MRRFCEHAIHVLATTQGKAWAEEYVRLRMEFHRKHGHGLIQSTYHGIEFFSNLLAAMNGASIEEMGEPKGEYRNNFIKLVALGSREA